MSSNFCLEAQSNASRKDWRLLIAVILAAARVAGAIGPPVVRTGEVVSIAGDQLTPLAALPIARLALLACAGAACRPVPFQIDERDPQGRWVLDRGPLPNADDPPGVLDDNDVLLFMAADAGDRAGRVQLPAGLPAIEIAIHDPLANTTHWAYLVAFAAAAPRATASYVEYDAATDRVHGRRVSLGFVKGMPGYLAVGAGAAAEVNLLDRLKVRASATFLFGLIHFARSEDDLRTEFMGWHQGPIRVVRGQRQWVRLGWGIRSPTFGSYTFFYPDLAELPVGLRLNFKPTYFFGNIVIRAVLDFRDLRGWSLVVPGVAAPIPIDGVMTPQKAALNRLSDLWFALQGPDITLVETMAVSPSLARLRHRLYYDETGAAADPPEAVPGEMPGIGYQLDRWEPVGAGAHQLTSVSYAIPPDVDVREFMNARETPLQITAQALP